MVDLDSLERYARDHQQQLLDEAARWRLVHSSDAPRRVKPSSPSVRARFAAGLRRVADRVEPATAPSHVGVLRAVAHREISVDEALRLLEPDCC